MEAQQNIYRFTYNYEMLGNKSNFNNIYESCAQQFKLSSWLDQETRLDPIFSCVARKHNEDGQYDLLSSFKKQFQRYTHTKEDTKKVRIFKKIQDNINKVLKLINTTYRHYFESFSQEFITIEQIACPKKNIPEENKPINFSVNGEQYFEVDSYYSVNLQRENEKLGLSVDEESNPFKLTTLIFDTRESLCYEIQVTITPLLSRLRPDLKEYFSYIYQVDAIQVLKLVFLINDKDNFLRRKVKDLQVLFPDVYQHYDQMLSADKIKIPFRQDRNKRQKRIEEQHYSLAFQGGGAKGLAYVGAYKALRQNRKIIQKVFQTQSMSQNYVLHKKRDVSIIMEENSQQDKNQQQDQEKLQLESKRVIFQGLSLKHQQKMIPEETVPDQGKRIPISSVIGSSAGGVIALAVSTGMSPRWMQKIVYKMMDIPEKDKYVNSNPEDKTSINKAYESIVAILSQYGLIHKSTSQKLMEVLKQRFHKIQNYLVTKIGTWMPSLGTILKNNDSKLNLEGLLVQGALMKGDLIHQIGAECLIRYFLKQYYIRESEQYGEYLDDCFTVNRSSKICLQSQFSKEDEQLAPIIIKCLQKYHRIGYQILEMSVEDIKKNYKNSLKIMTSMINTLILLITEKQEEKEQVQDVEDYKYIDQKLIGSFKWEILNEVFELKPINQLKLLINKDIKQESINQVSSLKDILKLYKGQYKKNGRDEYIQLLNKQYELRLLNDNIFNISKIKCNKTIRQYLRDLFGPDYQKYFDDWQHYKEISWKKKKEDNKMTQFDMEVAEIIINSFSLIVEDSQLPKVIQNFNENKRYFIHKVSTITMLEYYYLTSVELTCTSVDLDDKILRLFNKKTSPFLPVCKAVQMSGSFPGAFKAQKWQKNWGKYTTYYNRYKVEQDLTGHQFTDGGLLANFPIKYLDNDDICKKYFSHKPNSQDTKILGFGLDCLTDYSLNMKQKNDKDKFEKHNEQKMKDLYLTKQFTVFQMIGSTFDLIKSFLGKQKQETRDWADINHAIIEKVPILKFALKILDAYPNADRNFNTQAFRNRVIVQNIYERWKSSSILQREEQYIISQNVIKIQNILKRMKQKGDGQYFPTSKMISKPLEAYKEVDTEIDMIIKKCENQAYQAKQRFKIIKDSIRTMFENINISSFSSSDPWFQKRKEGNQVSIQMVKRLIVIFMMLLREASENFKRILAKQYIELKYPQTYSKIKEPLQYDVSDNIKRMIHYLYLKINKESNQPKNIMEDICSSISKQEYQRFYREAVENQGKQEKCFNYTNIKELFNKTVKEFVQNYKEKLKNFNSGKNLTISIKIIQMFQYFTSNDKSTSIKYIEALLKETLLIKGEEFNLSKNADEKIEQQMGGEAHESTFKKGKEIYVTKLKSSFLFEAQMRYASYKEDINELLLKQLSRKPIPMIRKYIKQLQGKQNEDVKNLLRIPLKVEDKIFNEFTQRQKDTWQNENTFTLMKLIRALTYYRNDQIDGTDRFTIQERRSIEDAILNIFFGRNRQKHEKFQKLIENIKTMADQENKQVEIFMKQLETIHYDEKEAKILQCYFLRYLQRIVLSFTIANKIKSQEERQCNSISEQQQMNKLYIHYIKDFNFIINCFKNASIILKTLNYHKTKRTEGFGQFSEEETFQYESLIYKLDMLLYYIHDQFIESYTSLSNRPNNTLNLATLQEIFIIKYEYIRDTIVQIYSPLKKRMIKLIHADKKSTKKEITFIKHILDIYDRITFYKPSLPLFQIDWRLNLKLQNVSFIHNGKIFQKPSSFAKEMEFVIIHQTKGKTMSQKRIQKMTNNQMNNIHLILEGVSTSNQYFCTYYNLLEQIMGRFLQDEETEQNNRVESFFSDKSQDKIDKFKEIAKEKIEKISHKLSKNKHNIIVNEFVKTITCSNYHVIFGFLLALHLNKDDLRKQTYKIKRIVNAFEGPQKITNYFQSYQWLSQTTNQFKDLVSYLQKERKQFFNQFQQLKLKSYINNSLLNDYKQIKMMMNSQTEHFGEFYSKILDEITNQIELVDGHCKPVLKPRQICKKFAFQYIEDAVQTRKVYSYDKLNQNAFQLFKDLVEVIFNTYGTLIEGILCSIISDYSSIIITENNSGIITKGIIIKRLLSTFKLKDYVQQKLRQFHLSPSITLSNFYDSAPKTILLNFSVININEQRLEFLNKITSPNMPIWAAIVASSSLPFLFDYFQAPVQWQGTSDKDTFYDMVIDKFFKDKRGSTKQTTEYCSANYISSLPLEMLTNTQVNKKLHNISCSREITIAFNNKYNNNFESLKMKKNYLNISNVWPYLKSLAYQKSKNALKKLPIVKWFYGSQQQVKDISYTSYYKNSLLKVANLKKTLETLTNSNDNFIMQWYKDKLIRLPIKFGTLDFHQIVDKQIFDAYKVQILSEKSKQTIERSYEITKSFTKYLTLPQKQRRKIQHHVKLRLEVVYNEDQNGMVHKFFKITLMNHSKYNRNKFNNFLVYYKMYDSIISNEQYSRALDSEIQWNIQNGAKLQLVFYFSFYPSQKKEEPKLKPVTKPEFNLRAQNEALSFPGKKKVDINIFDTLSLYFNNQSAIVHYPEDDEEQLNFDAPKVMYTKWIFDFAPIIDSLNDFKSSGITDADIFDYEFDYTNIHKKVKKDQIDENQFILVKPVSIKKMNIFGDQFKIPKLRIKRMREQFGLIGEKKSKYHLVQLNTQNQLPPPSSSKTLSPTKQQISPPPQK